MGGGDSDDRDHFGGLASFIQLAGVNVPARARFVGEAMVSATLSSVTVGLCCGMIGSSLLPVGPLLPFLLGSSTGYSFGLWQYWSNAKRTTFWIAQHYPTLLTHALVTEGNVVVPKEVILASKTESHRELSDTNKCSTTLESWIQQGGIGRLSWTVLAAQGCRNDVEVIQQQQRMRVVDDLATEQQSI